MRAAFPFRECTSAVDLAEQNVVSYAGDTEEISRRRLQVGELPLRFLGLRTLRILVCLGFVALMSASGYSSQRGRLGEQGAISAGSVFAADIIGENWRFEPSFHSDLDDPFLLAGIDGRDDVPRAFSGEVRTATSSFLFSAGNFVRAP